MFADHYAGSEYRDEFNEFTEQGEQFFEYYLSTFTDVKTAQNESFEFVNKPISICETFHKGVLKEKYEGLSIDKDNVSITCIKNSYENNGTIIRFMETQGIDTNFTFKLFDNEYSTQISHNGVKTLLIDGKSVKEVNFIEW